MVNCFEGFYRQGVILQRINVDAEYKDAGYASFESYMNQAMPCGIEKTQAYRLIVASKARPLLPSFPSEGNGIWTPAAIEPLTHKDFKPADVKRLGKKIETRVKKGESLTASLVKSICDEDRGVENTERKKKSAEIAATDTPSQTIATV